MRVLYSILYSLMLEWLSGSLLLTFMLALLWVASKWRVLRWLTRTRNRWLFIWGSLGTFKQLAIGVFVWITFFRDLGGLDGMSWPMQFAQSTLRLGYSRASILASICLGAFVAVAIDLGFAAFSWSFFRRLTQWSQITRSISQVERYGVSLLISTCAFGIANYLNFHRQTWCDDCVLPYGIPFTFLLQGGFVSITRFVWKGVIGDFLVVFALAGVLGFVWNQLSRKYSNLRATTAARDALGLHE